MKRNVIFVSLCLILLLANNLFATSVAKTATIQTLVSKISDVDSQISETVNTFSMEIGNIHMDNVRKNHTYTLFVHHAQFDAAVEELSSMGIIEQKTIELINYQKARKDIQENIAFLQEQEAAYRSRIELYRNDVQGSEDLFQELRSIKT